ncbi:MAG TPA: hypothetical protein VNI55_02045 [Gaiellaceae bacterium]|nr:hypothetical protein [Gaiellaceae bacterium]
MDRVPESVARVIPLVVAAQAIPILGAFWLGGRIEVGALWAGIVLAMAALLAFGGRSETLRTLRGVEDDERVQHLELQATAVVAVVLLVGLFGLLIAEGIRGGTGLVYAVLLLVAEVAHVVALGVLIRPS